MKLKDISNQPENEQEIPKPPVVIDGNSTFINPSIDSKQKLKDWVLTMLGYPLITVELTDAQFEVCILNALDVYTKYAYFEEKYLMVDANNYDPQLGLDLSFWKVASVKDISTMKDRMYSVGYGTDMLFGWPAFMKGAFGGGPYFGSTRPGTSMNFAGGFVTYHNLIEFKELAERITGSNPDWTFDRVHQRLILMPPPPPPRKRNKDELYRNWILLTCELEPPLDELYGNEYVRRLVLAYAKILLGTIRKKFSSVQLVGGGQIDTSIGDEGREELNTLMENIRADESRGNFFYIG